MWRVTCGFIHVDFTDRKEADKAVTEVISFNECHNGRTTVVEEYSEDKQVYSFWQGKEKTHTLTFEKLEEQCITKKPIMAKS